MVKDIIGKFHKECDNIHPVRKMDGTKYWYRHPDVAKICEQAYERGDEYFYLTPEFQFPIKEVEPHYVYKVDKFSEEEYNELIELLKEKKMKWIFEKYLGDGAIYARCGNCGWEYNCSKFNFAKNMAEICCVHKYCSECGQKAENSEESEHDVIWNERLQYE